MDNIIKSLETDKTINGIKITKATSILTPRSPKANENHGTLVP